MGISVIGSSGGSGPQAPRVFAGGGKFTNLNIPAGTVEISSPAGGKLGSKEFGPGQTALSFSSPVNTLLLNASATQLATFWRSGYAWAGQRSYRDDAVYQRSICYNADRTVAYALSNGTNGNYGGDSSWQYRSNIGGYVDLWLNTSANYGRCSIMAKTTTGTVWAALDSPTFWANSNLNELTNSATSWTFGSPNNGNQNVRDIASTQVSGQFVAVGNARNIWTGTTGAAPTASLLADSNAFPGTSGNWTRVCAKPGASGYYVVAGASNALLKSSGPTISATADFSTVVNPISTSALTVNNIAYNEENNTWLIVNGTTAAVSTNDMATWTSVTLPFNGDTLLFHAGGYFFKLTGGRTMWVSENGISWSVLKVESVAGVEMASVNPLGVIATKNANGTYSYYLLGIDAWTAYNSSILNDNHATWASFTLNPPAASLTRYQAIETGVA